MGRRSSDELAAVINGVQRAQRRQRTRQIAFSTVEVEMGDVSVPDLLQEGAIGADTAEDALVIAELGALAGGTSADMLASLGTTRLLYATTEPEGIDGEVWANIVNRQVQRLVGGVWVDVDDRVERAVLAVGTAAAITDGVVNLQVQSNPPTGKRPEDAGDIWVDTDDSNHLHRWDGASYESLLDPRIDEASQIAKQASKAAQDATTAAEGAIEDAAAAIQAAADAAGIAGGKADFVSGATEPAAAFRKSTTLWNDTTYDPGSMNGVTPRQWTENGLLYGDPFEGVQWLTAGNAPGEFTLEPGQGRNSTRAFRGPQTASYRTAVSPVGFNRAHGFSVETWVRFPTLGTRLGGIVVAATAGTTSGIHALLDARNGAAGTSSAPLQVRLNNSQAAGSFSGVSITGGIVADVWYRLKVDVTPSTVTATVYDASGAELGSTSFSSTATQINRVGFTSYNGPYFDDFSITGKGWRVMLDPVVRDAAQLAQNAAGAAASAASAAGAAADAANAAHLLAEEVRTVDINNLSGQLSLAEDAVDSLGTDVFAIKEGTGLGDKVLVTRHFAARSITGNEVDVGTLTVQHVVADFGKDLDISANGNIELIASDVSEVVKKADGTQQALVRHQTVFSVTPQGAVISSPGSQSQVSITNERIAFNQSGQAQAWLDAGILHVRRAELEVVALGRHQIEKAGTAGTIVRAL